MAGFISTALAQEAAQAQNAPQELGTFQMFLPFIIIIAIFYLLIIRPQQKQQKQRQNMLNQLKRGDEVITSGGIYGKISEIQDKVVMLQVANNLTIKLDRTQVNTVLNPTAVVAGK